MLEGRHSSSFASGSTAPIRRGIEASFGQMPTTSARRLISLFKRSSGFVECSSAPGPVLGGGTHVGRHVVLAVVHGGGELGPARAELIGHVPEGLVVGRFLPTGLERNTRRVAAAAMPCCPSGP